MRTFYAVDVETANSSRHSICQIGIAHCDSRGKVHIVVDALVNPETPIQPANARIHGITDKRVMYAETLPALESRIRSMLTGQIVVSHTEFDRQAVDAAFRRYHLSPLKCIWLDSRDVAYATWQLEGYRLPDVADHLGIRHKHHDAADDARVAAEIVVRAVKQTGYPIEKWLTEQPGPPPARPQRRRGCLRRVFALSVVIMGIASLAAYKLQIEP